MSGFQASEYHCPIRVSSLDYVGMMLSIDAFTVNNMYNVNYQQPHLSLSMSVFQAMEMMSSVNAFTVNNTM